MEAVGIEPTSEEQSSKPTTSLVSLLFSYSSQPTDRRQNTSLIKFHLSRSSFNLSYSVQSSPILKSTDKSKIDGLTNQAASARLLFALKYSPNGLTRLLGTSACRFSPWVPVETNRPQAYSDFKEPIFTYNIRHKSWFFKFQEKPLAFTIAFSVQIFQVQI